MSSYSHCNNIQDKNNNENAMREALMCAQQSDKDIVGVSGNVITGQYHFIKKKK